MAMDRELMVLSLLLTAVCGYFEFQSKIPNGDRVPHPCPQNSGVWAGAGHRNDAGAGDLNPFGQDFQDNNYVWDECLCRYDSDGDGLTNGEELGDPDCTWMEGDLNNVPDQLLSHPGVCEPVDDVTCRDKNDWLECTTGEEPRCAAIDHPDTRSLEMVIPRSAVPVKETTFICSAFSLDDELAATDHHIVAVEPIIDNPTIMHHMIVYGCENYRADLVSDLYHNSTRCGMVGVYCPNLVYLWTYGFGDECLGEQYGYPLGANGYKALVLEFHWNNPQLLTDETDASGIRVHYTPLLRPNEASSFYAGPLYLEIPPQQKSWKEVGHCLSGCMTDMLPHTVYISKIGPHMHLKGIAMSVELLDAEGGATVLVNDTTYDYNAPKWFRFDPPIALDGSNTLRITCDFDSTDTDQWTFFSEETSSEMCIAVVEYYPRQFFEIPDCHDIGPGIGICHGGYGEELTEECQLYADQPGSMGDFTAIYELLHQSCDPTGYSCHAGCPEAIQVAKTNLCLHDGIIKWAKWNIFDRVFPDKLAVTLMLASCDGLDLTSDDGDHDDDDDAPPTTQSSLQEWCERMPAPSAAPLSRGVISACALAVIVALSLVNFV